MSLEEHQFELLADELLNHLEQSLGEIDPDDCDVELSMGVLTLEFADGARFVINSHRAARQIWMAANTRAWHFSYDPERQLWFGDRAGEELIPTIEAQVALKLGRIVKI